jgi:Sulphur transport
MTVAIASFVFLLAAVCAALMGYAIQRGATCTVAAVGEIVREGTANRLIAMGEAALWVAGGLLIARALGLTVDLPSGFATTGWTILGAMLLGFGAWVNSACVFGAIAKFGSGEWAYVMTPVGFYFGALSMSSLFPSAMPVPSAATHVLPDWLVFAFILFAAWRLIALARNIRNHPRKGGKVWDPHEATIIIGIALVIMFVGVGDWTYMNVLTRLAHGMADDINWRLILFCALLGGAILGGWTAGRLSSRLPTASGLMRCTAGGLLMGWGSALIPGSNDGLILIGMPLLHPYAWVGVAVMAATIWVALKIEQRVAAR